MSKTLTKKNKSKIWQSYQSQNLTKRITKILVNKGKYTVKKKTIQEAMMKKQQWNKQID